MKVNYLPMDRNIRVQDLDSDNDGMISKWEFHNWYLQRQGIAQHVSEEDGHVRYIPHVEVDEEVTTEDTAPPNSNQLRLLALQAGLPFIGFGFLDNFVMILAGDVIEINLGATFGLSAIAAAALGNTLSDIFGIQAGSGVERLAKKLGLPEASLSKAQRLHSRSYYTTLFGSILGVVIGCFLGMVPLLWIDLKERNLKNVFKSLDTDGDGVIRLGELADKLFQLGIDPSKKELDCILQQLTRSERKKLTFEEFKETVAEWERLIENDSDNKST